MTTPRESVDCSGCPACQMALKEREAALGLRCRICLELFAELWPVQSKSQPDLCRRCASAGPKRGLGATYGRHNPLPGGTTAEKPGEAL